VMRGAANEESCRKHDGTGMVTHQCPSAPDWTRAVRS
jgi:hypothetical protein